MRYRIKKGMALFVVLGVVSLFAIAVAAFMFVTSSQTKITKRQNDSTKAFYLAEAGLQRSVFELRNYWAAYKIITGTVTKNDTLGAGGYEVKIDPPSHVGGTYTFNVTSTGTVGDLERQIEQAIRVEDAIKNWDFFKEYVLYFGGGEGTVDIGKEATVTGSVLVDGDMSIGKEFYISGDAVASGTITTGQDVTIVGDEIPGADFEELELPDRPEFTTSPYDGKITDASGEDVGDRSFPAGKLSDVGGVIYVNGAVSITGDITVGDDGTHTIVATGAISIGQDVEIGPGITLIAGGNLSADQDYTVGSNCLLYSSTLVTLAKDGNFGSSGAGEGSVIATLGDVDIAKSLGFYGLIIASGNISIAKDSEIRGNIVGEGTTVESNPLTIGKNAQLIVDGTLVNFDSIPGLSTTGSGVPIVTPLHVWEEIPGA